MCKFFIKPTVLSLVFLELGCSTPFKESTGQIDPGTPSSATQETQDGEFLPLKTITLPFEHKSTVEQSLGDYFYVAASEWLEEKIRFATQSAAF